MSIETTIASAVGKIGEFQDVQRLIERKEGFSAPLLTQTQTAPPVQTAISTLLIALVVCAYCAFRPSVPT